MGLYQVKEGTQVWFICEDCGVTREQREAERASGIFSECAHLVFTEICDDEECEACNDDPALQALGLR